MSSSSEPKRAIVSYNPQEKLWTLEESYTYVDQDRDVKITVNKGSKFDLSSVPRFFWRIISPFDLSVEAPLIHDFLYVTQGGRKKDEKERMKGAITDLTPQRRTYSRKDADDLFRQMMKESSVRDWRVVLGYRAVRVFGQRYWKACQTVPQPEPMSGVNHQPSLGEGNS